MQVRTKFYIFSWGSFPLCFQDGLHSYEVWGLWMLLMQGGVEHAGGTQPAQEGSSLQCRGLLGWGVIERISLGRNIIRSVSLQGSCLGKVSWKIDHRKEGQCARHQLSDIRRAWNPLGGGFLSSSHSDLPHYQRRPRYWTVLTKLPMFQAYDKVPYTNSNMGKPSWRGLCPSNIMFPCPTVPRHDTLVFWAATKLSVGPFIQLWTKKNKHAGTAQQRKLGQPATLVRFPDL